MSTRTCGNCSACCTVLGVKTINKQPYQTCAHDCHKGCAIYSTRPASCADYACGWLQGFGEGRDRPDRLGVILDHLAPSDEARAKAAAGDASARAAVDTASKTIRAREVWPGAFGGRRVKAALQAIHASGMLVVLVPFAGRRLPVGRAL